MSAQATVRELPLVSIVIPAFNHADYLAESIGSVLAQDYSHVELIVIDDGSTDNTVAVLQGMDKAFYWESQSNAGQSKALTRGWELAQGDILAYLSADDFLEPEAVRSAVSALEENPEAAVCYGDFTLLDPQSRKIRTIELPEFSYEDMLTRVSCPIGPGAFFRREAYLKAGPWNPQFRQMPDFDFWLRLGLHGKFIHLSRVLAGFRIHEGSQTYSVTDLPRAEEPITIVSNLLDRQDAAFLNEKARNRAMASANLVSAQLHLRAGRVGVAVHNIRQALHYSVTTVLAPRTLRLLINAAINRTAHRLLWTLRGKGKA